MINQMTLTSFVKYECCNFQSDECLGVDLIGKRFRNQGSCYMAEKEPCEYFLSCVLPVAKEKGYDNVISQYRKIDRGIEQAKVRNCSCGVQLSKGKKFCEKCRKKRRQKTNKENLRKYRG